jgi:hypothetical protein
VCLLPAARAPCTRARLCPARLCPPLPAAAPQRREWQYGTLPRQCYWPCRFNTASLSAVQGRAAVRPPPLPAAAGIRRRRCASPVSAAAYGRRRMRGRGGAGAAGHGGAGAPRDRRRPGRPASSPHTRMLADWPIDTLAQRHAHGDTIRLTPPWRHPHGNTRIATVP